MRKLCEFCQLFIRRSEDAFSIAIGHKTRLPIPVTELIPEDAKVYTFSMESQAREWFHRKEWERVWFDSPEQQLRLSNEEKHWIEFHSEIRERIDVKKSELERLLRAEIIKNVTQGLEIHGFKITPKREIFNINTQKNEAFCGLGGLVGEGIERATDIIAMFELYLEYVHADEIKREGIETGEAKSFKAAAGHEERALQEIKKVIESVEEQKKSDSEKTNELDIERSRELAQRRNWPTKEG